MLTHSQKQNIVFSEKTSCFFGNLLFLSVWKLLVVRVASLRSVRDARNGYVRRVLLLRSF